MTNSIEILLMVIAVGACVLGLAGTALYFLNRAVDAFDRRSTETREAATETYFVRRIGEA